MLIPKTTTGSIGILLFAIAWSSIGLCDDNEPLLVLIGASEDAIKAGFGVHVLPTLTA